MSILVIGARSGLGSEIMSTFFGQGVYCLGVDADEIDITNEAESIRYIETLAPTHIIHCLEYSNVEQAEQEPERCHTVNVIGTRSIAEACRRLDAVMMYISSHLVFNGQAAAPYETDMQRTPLNQYGRSKMLAELEIQRLVPNHFILRSSWPFGGAGTNIVRSLYESIHRSKEIRVPNDQISSPSYTVDIAQLISQLIHSKRYGIYHVHNEGECSLYELAAETRRLGGGIATVRPAHSDALAQTAPMPLNARLSTAGLLAAGFAALPHWKDALERYIQIWLK